MWLMKFNRDVYVLFLLNILMETKMSLLYKLECKNKIKLHNKTKFQPRT